MPRRLGKTIKMPQQAVSNSRGPHKYTAVLLITTTLYLMLFANKNTAAVRMK